MANQGSLKKIEGFVYENLLDKRKKIKPKNKIGDFVRTADLKRTFSKGGITNWSLNFRKVGKMLKIQYRFITFINYQSVTMKPD